MMSEKDAWDDWNDAHVIRKVVSRQQAVPAELMTAAKRGATSSKPDTDLDLDDVAATIPKAKAELEALRAENARLRADVAKWQSLAEGFEKACNSAIGKSGILANANRYVWVRAMLSVEDIVVVGSVCYA